MTDARLFLGRLPQALAGGSLSLDKACSEKGIHAIANNQGLSPEEAACGIIEVAAWNQALAIRQMTVNQGKDPREFVLVAFGGAGPLMAADIAEVLDVREIVVPPQPGCGSAVGLVEVDLRNDYVRTLIARLDEISPDKIEIEFQKMEEEADADLKVEQVDSASRVFVRSVDLRYFGEGQEMRVNIPPAETFAEATRLAVDRFHEEYKLQFDFNYENQTPVEMVNLRLTAIGEMKKAPRKRMAEGKGAETARTGERPVYFASSGFVETPVYDHDRLGKGDRIEGPAIVEDFGATTVISPGSRCGIDDWGNLRMSLPAGEKGETESASNGGQSENEPSPVVQEIVEGALYAAEREMEDLVERTARSPLIRNMHDYRVGLFDREGRKLTGRSYSAVVDPFPKNGTSMKSLRGMCSFGTTYILPRAASATYPICVRVFRFSMILKSSR